MRVTGPTSRYLATALIACLAAAFVPEAARAADLRVVPFGAGQAIVSLRGEIGIGDGRRLEALIGDVVASGRSVVDVDLDSMGGNAWGGFDLARVMLRHHLASSVQGVHTCASSCFTAFVLGSPRFIGPNATLGIHRSTVGGKESAQSEAATVDMAILYHSIGVPAAVIGEMVTTPNKSLHVLGQPEQAALGAVFTLNGLPPEGWRPKAPPADDVGVVTKLDADINSLADMGQSGKAFGVNVFVMAVAGAILVLGAFLGIVAFLGLMAAVRVWRSRSASTRTVRPPMPLAVRST